MKIAIVVFDKINLISLANINHALHELGSGYSISVCAFKSEIVDEYGLRITPQVYAESLFGYDAIVIADGVGSLTARYDEIFLSWIRSASRAKVKIALDLGALILGGAGFLQDKKACVRAGYKNALKEYCEFVDEPICQSDEIVTISEFNADARRFLSEILKKK